MTTTFGTLLRQARELAGIDIQTVARHLVTTETPGTPWDLATAASMIQYLKTVEADRNYPPHPTRVAIICQVLQTSAEVTATLVEAARAGQPPTLGALPVTPVADSAGATAYAEQMLARDAQRK